ncbi:MAG TPA: hypothetical protein VLG16_03580 [Candidatus Saccharimonadales bacterium]|nr:hypothetical protein [Candidatus Saccharimonadales bacterium]
MDILQPRPVHTLRDALQGAKKGETPPFTTDEFLARLGLDGDQPDGKALYRRLIDGSSIFGLRAFVQVELGVKHLLEKTNEQTANPQQEELAQTLGAVLTKQVTREETICSTARGLALASTREDIVPEAVRAKLADPEFNTFL